jgi:hypothetical protein
MKATYQQVNMIPFTPLPQSSVTTDPSAYHANNAESSCIEGEKAAGKNIAAKHADKLPTGNEESKKQGRNGSIETQHFYIKAGFSRNCDHCGNEYIAKRNTSKFCSRRCRVNAHRARQGGQK